MTILREARRGVAPDGVRQRLMRQNRQNGCSCPLAERQDKELYITPDDVQTQPVIFFNICLALMLKTWYTFHKFRNR